MLNPANAPLDAMQQTVDELAAALDRSVAVDDPRLDLICASAQHGPIDDRRVNAIIHRSGPQEPIPWILGHGIESARGPVRLPANPEFGMLPRVCAPIREEGRLYGFLWLFDVPALSAEELAAAAAAAHRVGQLLHRQRAGLAERVEAVERAAAALLSSADAEEALDDAVTAGLLPRDGAFRVVATAVSGASDAPAQELLGELVRAEQPLVARCEGDHCIAILRAASEADFGRATKEIGRRAGFAEVECAPFAWAAVDGELDFGRALRKARYAAHVRDALGWPAEDVSWEGLGTWRVLFPGPLSLATARSICDEFEPLLERANEEQLRTLLVFLDSGRSVQAACAELAVHRGTVHYRLDRIRRIVGAELLDDGWRSAALHLALQLWWSLRAR